MADGDDAFVVASTTQLMKTHTKQAISNAQNKVEPNMIYHC